jgi:hypothetical protein
MSDECVSSIYYSDSAFASGQTKSTNEGSMCSAYINITLVWLYKQVSMIHVWMIIKRKKKKIFCALFKSFMMSLRSAHSIICDVSEHCSLTILISQSDTEKI